MQICCVSLLMERPVSSNAPTAFTPVGGYGDTSLGRYERELPAPTLGDDEALADGVPDLRGTWKVAELLVNGVAAPTDHHLWAHFERIEQSGNRVIVVGGGVIHDFASCDGTLENGLHDVMAIDFSTPLQVAATLMMACWSCVRTECQLKSSAGARVNSWCGNTQLLLLRG